MLAQTTSVCTPSPIIIIILVQFYTHATIVIIHAVRQCLYAYTYSTYMYMYRVCLTSKLENFNKNYKELGTTEKEKRQEETQMG